MTYIIDDENEVINEETMNYIYQMTELKKKPVIINTPINDIFKDKNMRDIIFGYKRESMINDEKDFESIIQKGKDTRNNLRTEYIGKLKIGDRYEDSFREVYQIVKITAKSVIALPVETIEIDVSHFRQLNNIILDNKWYPSSYTKYTDKLGTKKHTKRKTSMVGFFRNPDMEICFFCNY